MSRLQAEFHRLYQAADAAAADPTGLLDARSCTRALVLEIGRPAAWEPLATVWTGVQVDLGWPAPAIAVSGRDALQLWFSLAAPVDLPTGRAVLDAVCRRYLPDLPAHRLRLLPEADPPMHADMIPAEQRDTGHWSAFVAPDLAPLFAETPWLDLPPGDTPQARTLGGLASITAAQLASVLPSASAPTVQPLAPPADDPIPAASSHPRDPLAFLLSVMRDERVPLALRVQAATAALPYTTGRLVADRRDRSGPGETDA